MATSYLLEKNLINLIFQYDRAYAFTLPCGDIHLSSFTNEDRALFTDVRSKNTGHRVHLHSIYRVPSVGNCIIEQRSMYLQDLEEKIPPNTIDPLFGQLENCHMLLMKRLQEEKKTSDVRLLCTLLYPCTPEFHHFHM